MAKHRIAVIPGDGIGNEVMPEGLRAIEAAGALTGIDFEFLRFDWSCERYKATGAMMPDDGIDRLRDHDAVFLGAVGFPGVGPAGADPARVRPVCQSAPRAPAARHHAPGARQEARRHRFLGGAREHRGRIQPGWRHNVRRDRPRVRHDREFVSQQSVFTRKGCDRITRYAFELAKAKGKTRVDGATKSNGIFISMPYWDQRFKTVAAEYPKIENQLHHIDILCARLVMQPELFEVIVATNLFGDILSDLGPGVTGTIAVAPSANINPEREHPSMFEPVHGSAPDIAGMGIANPIGQIWSASMMLDHLGEPEAAAAIMRGIETVMTSNSAPKTPDLGGSGHTVDLGQAIADAIAREG
jgi:tartrate dehydrogenase/decarboxylase/D-malate dehydrogenase